ncbi:MAG: Hpt domain-containing protein [Bacteroidota bacterium]
MSNLTDLTFLKGLTNGDAAKLTKYINMFLKATPDMLDNLDKYYAEKDWESLRVTAHSLKPQLSYMGIKSLEEAIKTIEFNAGHQMQLDKMPEMIAHLREQCVMAMKELEEALKTIS